ncbi:MAG TPA: hypothetical protein ENJ28_11800 [Gammaproteobacteria bacterium]|nr:hypothetical protein [Gammaproteobacteria bacterium]
MNTLTLFLLEVILCIGISTSVIYLLKPLLREILTDTCGNQTRAEFWVMFTQLMLFIAPLLIVIFFASTEAVTNIHVVEVLQDTLFRSLLGEFIALAMIGQVIWKSIDATAEHAIPDALIATDSKKQGG